MKKYNKENLECLVAESCTLTEVLKKLGLVARGSNFKTLKRYLNKFDIDYTHFTPNGIRIKKLKAVTNNRKFVLENILVKNSTYLNTTNIKNKLYAEGIKKRECELCGQNELWKLKKISLILDHINGIHTDNRLENLRIVCPNCNAALPTHCGKNKRKAKQNYCKCGNTILKNSTLCKKCNYINLRKIKERPTKNMLLEELTKSSYVQVGKKYNVSDNTIRKWVK